MTTRIGRKRGRPEEGKVEFLPTRRDPHTHREKVEIGKLTDIFGLTPLPPTVTWTTVFSIKRDGVSYKRMHFNSGKGKKIQL